MRRGKTDVGPLDPHSRGFLNRLRRLRVAYGGKLEWASTRSWKKARGSRRKPADGLTREGDAPTALMILLLFNPALTGWAKGWRTSSARDFFLLLTQP
jgi:hypothetical protein